MKAMRLTCRTGFMVLLLTIMTGCAENTPVDATANDPRFHPTFPHIHEGMTAKQVDQTMKDDGFGPVQSSLIGATLTVIYSAMILPLSHLDVIVQYDKNLVANNVAYFSN